MLDTLAPDGKYSLAIDTLKDVSRWLKYDDRDEYNKACTTKTRYAARARLKRKKVGRVA